MDMMELRKEIDAHHDTLKESKDYVVKFDSLRRVGEATAAYIAEAYKAEGLYDYRKIEGMAERMRKMTTEDLDLARSYRRRGQTWRATIALNSVGLDFYILQSQVEKILAASGKFREELAEHLPRKRFLIDLEKRLKKLLGHDRRSDAFDFAPVIEEVKHKLAAETERDPAPSASGDTATDNSNQ